MKRFFAVLLMPVLLFSGAASAYSLYRCRYDQVARKVCCCPGTSHEQATDAHPAATIEKNCCCDIETVRESPPASEAARVQPPEAVAPLLAAVLPFATHVFATARNLPLLVEEPRGVGPPIILLKRSFQI